MTMYLAFVGGVNLATWPLVRHLATSWAWHHDPYLFTWVMASLVEQLTTDPGALFHGRAAYPYGSSLAFSDPLLVPALLGAPGFLLDQPVLTYNLLLVLLWPLNGLAAAWVAHRLTGSRPAAWLAGVAFCLCPYFTEFHLEFRQILDFRQSLVLETDPVQEVIAERELPQRCHRSQRLQFAAQILRESEPHVQLPAWDRAPR
jgi:hypothetical protein